MGSQGDVGCESTLLRRALLVVAWAWLGCLNPRPEELPSNGSRADAPGEPGIDLRIEPGSGDGAPEATAAVPGEDTEAMDAPDPQRLLPPSVPNPEPAGDPAGEAAEPLPPDAGVDAGAELEGDAG